jgi:outer membrane lipoprotein-sorting protein
MTNARRLVLVAALASSSAGVGSTIDPLDDLLARGRAAQAAVHSLSASFTETTISSLLREPIVANGTLVAAKPVRVLMTYTSPTAKSMLVDATHVTVVWPGRSERERIDIAQTQRRVQKYFVDASSKDLRASFDIRLSNDPDLRDAFVLDMTPKRQQIKEGIQRLRIWIEPVRLVMVKMTMDYPGGDRRTLELRDIRLNVPIDNQTFIIR